MKNPPGGGCVGLQLFVPVVGVGLQIRYLDLRCSDVKKTCYWFGGLIMILGNDVFDVLRGERQDNISLE